MSKTEWAKCPNGHQYSPDLPTCPYCPASTPSSAPRRNTPTDGDTVVAPASAAPRGETDRTRPFPGVSAPQESTGTADRTIVEGQSEEHPTVAAPSPTEPWSRVVGTPPPGSASPPPGARKTRVMQVGGQDPAELRPIFAWLVVLEGAQQYQDFRISQEQVYIGDSEECDIVLNDEFISGEHASIRYRDGKFTITDLDSKNGTFVNDMDPDKRIDRVELRDGDEIRMGQVLMKFKCL